MTDDGGRTTDDRRPATFCLTESQITLKLPDREQIQKKANNRDFRRGRVRQKHRGSRVCQIRL